MATMMAAGQRATWRLAAKESGQGRRIYQALLKETQSLPIGQAHNEIVTQNSQLIRTVTFTI